MLPAASVLSSDLPGDSFYESSRSSSCHIINGGTLQMISYLYLSFNIYIANVLDMSHQSSTLLIEKYLPVSIKKNLLRKTKRNTFRCLRGHVFPAFCMYCSCTTENVVPRLNSGWLPKSWLSTARWVASCVAAMSGQMPFARLQTRTNICRVHKF